MVTAIKRTTLIKLSNILLSSSILFISPVIVFIKCIIESLLSYKNTSLLFLVVFFSYFFSGFNFPYGFDFHTHMELYKDYITNGSPTELYNKYFGLAVLMQVANFFEGGERFFLWVTLLILFYTISVISRRASHTSGAQVFIFTIISIAMPLIILASGIRYSIAICFFILSLFSLKDNKKLLFLLFTFLSLSFHYAAIILYIILFISVFVKISKDRNFNTISIFFILCFSLIFPTLILNLIVYILHVTSLQDIVRLDLTRYTNGQWGIGRFSYYNFNGLLGYFIPKFSLLIAFLFFIRGRNNLGELDIRFITCCGVFCVSTFLMGDIGDRVSIVLLFLLAAYHASQYKARHNVDSLLCIIVLCFSSLLSSFIYYPDVYLNLFTERLTFGF